MVVLFVHMYKCIYVYKEKTDMFTRNMKIIEYDDDIISYEDIKTKNN